MADAYSYRLLVELEENNIPRLKNKLVKYFQSKKSNGGDCEVEYESGSRTATLRFRTEEDQRNVLGKEVHQISLDKSVLKMTVRLPPDQKAAQEAPPDKLDEKSELPADNKQSSADEPTSAAEVQTEEEEELCSTLSVLGNIPESFGKEFLEMLVENVLKDLDSSTASQDFTLEVLPAISSAVVTFKSEKENTDFMTRCTQNRMFTKKGLSVRPLEVTKQVVVEDIQNYNEDFLQMYFEKEGGDVENALLNEVEQSAIITFKDHKAVQKVLKKKHHIKQKELRVYPFYESLGTALYGKDEPSLKLPAAISEPVDSAVWRYLTVNHSAAETIRRELEKHFCDVNLRQSPVRLSPMPSLFKQKDAKAIIKQWKDTVESAFSQAVSKFRSREFQTDVEVWEESEAKFRQALQSKDVVVVPDKASGVLSVVGLVDEVNSVEQTLQEVVNNIAKRVQREKFSITQVIKVSPSIVHILCQDGLQDKLLRVFPALKMSYSKDSPDFTVTGLNDEVLGANKVICEAIMALKRKILEIDNYVIDLLKCEEQEELTDALLTAHGKSAAFEISGQRVQLLAASDRALIDAEDHLGKLLISGDVDVEDSKVLDKPEWQALVSQLEDANSKSCMRLKIHTTRQQVVVSGHKDSVIKVSTELEDFLKQNAQVAENIVVKPHAIVEYVKKFSSTYVEQVTVSYRNESICLSGSRADVANCKILVEEFVSSVFFESLNVSKPGVKKFFKDKETMYVSSLLNQTGCLVQLVDGTHGQDDFAKPVYQLQAADGVEIAVFKADMCSYPTHAVVNSSNSDLKHNGGLSAALLKAAGSQLQDDCDKIIRLKGKLKPGDCVITGATGKLCCKKVIHAVGPTFDPNKSQKAQAQLKKAVKGSLDLAEKNGCTSVALPAISRSQGFALDLCAITIIKAIKEYFDERYDDNTLKKIHLVNIDDAAVQAMERAVRLEFGNHGVVHSQQTLLTKATQSVVKLTGPAGSDKNCLGRVRTKEGLEISLITGQIQEATILSAIFKDCLEKAEGTGLTSISFPAIGTGNLGFPRAFSGMHETKMRSVTIQVVTGDITKETTDVIVNSSNETFSLKSGVSKAILDAAGQAVEAECQNLGAQPNPGLIMTQSGNLQCKKILHLVGQTDPIKINKVVKDALEMCVKNSYTSVSFPAIGTGQGNVKARQVADAMMDAVIDVLSQYLTAPLKTVRVVIFQPPMLKDFYDSMHQREGTETKAEAKNSAGFFGKIKALFIGDNASKPQKEADFVIEAQKIDPACFHICDHQRIVDMQKTMGVCIRIESKNAKATMTIEGFTKDVLKATTEIQDMLTKVRNEKELMKKVEVTGTLAEWQYQQQGLQFQSFDPMTNYELEQALKNNAPNVKVKVNGQDYTVTMPSGPATDSQGRTLQIKRIDKLKVDEDFPQHWDPIPPNNLCHAVIIQAGTAEYNEVQSLFQASCKRTITKIERIQNPGLWKSLQIKKHEMDQRNGHQNNERRLFHGTCHTTVNYINYHGFNRSYAGKNAACYGNGTYFAVNASYSAQDTYSRPNQNGEKCMYLCRVLTGDFTRGQQNMIVPPAKGSSSIDKYDSVVDNVSAPSMFIVFHDTQACPEYLITFK
ncbi:hypothetical protein INR49_006457 [Caranx melampygus]|nr:hypothetical protein INR49_006457 [Caranx melampygus]